MVVPGDVLRRFMLAAHELGYPQSGHYVFMDVVLFHFPGRYWGDHLWRRNDRYDQQAREAYEAMLRVALYHSYGEEWLRFSQTVVSMAAQHYNFTLSLIHI